MSSRNSHFVEGFKGFFSKIHNNKSTIYFKPGTFFFSVSLLLYACNFVNSGSEGESLNLCQNLQTLAAAETV